MVEWLVVSGGVALFAGVQVTEARRRKKYRETYRYIRILQHEQNEQTVDQIKRWVQVLSEYKRTFQERQRKGREWFRLLFHKNREGEIAIYFGFPEDRITGLKNLIKNTYPFSEIHDVPHEELPLGLKVDDSSRLPGKKKKQDMECGYFDLQTKGQLEGLALQSYAGEDSLEEILLSLHAVESEAWLDVVFSPESNKKIKRQVERTMKGILEKKKQEHIGRGNQSMWEGIGEELKQSLDAHNRKFKPKQSAKPADKKVTLQDLDQDERSQMQMMQKRYTGREAAFLTTVRLLVVGDYAQALAQTAAAHIRSHYQLDNGLRFIKSRGLRQKIEDRVPYRPPHTFLMTGDELANLVRLPAAQHRVMENVPYLKKGQRSLDPDELKEGISVGTLIHPMQKNRHVRIPHRQMNKMFLLTGKTGSGKSSELLEMLDSLMEDWIENPKTAPGFTLSDPARDTAATILNRLLQKEKEGKPIDWSRVHYFHAADKDYSIPLNLLYAQDGEMPDDIVQAAMEMLTRLYSGLNAPQMERVLRSCLTTLVLDRKQKHTILGILPLLRDQRFRKRVLANVHEPTILEFWKHDFPPLEAKLEQVISPILNRLSPFNTNKLMQRMFGQPEWKLNIRKWMDEGHIVLFNWRGVNDQILALAGEKITNQYHAEFQSRSTGAKTHYCIWDEAHRTPFPIINKMLAEDRKFGASCGFSTQFPEQLPADLLKSFKENAGNLLTTTLGKDSAGIIQGATAGKFTAQFLQDLPERVVAIYTAVEREGRTEQTTFTVTCTPPFLYHPDGSGRWANHKDEAEMLEAIEWGLSKGRELMARDTTPAHLADEIINEYLRPGSALKTLAAMEQEDAVTPEEPKEKLVKASTGHRRTPPSLRDEEDQEEAERAVAASRRAQQVPSLLEDEDDVAAADEMPIASWDDLFEQAEALVIEAQQASEDLLQRKMGIGREFCIRLIEALEMCGIVGPADGQRPREVLVPRKKAVGANEPPFTSAGGRWE